MSKPTKRPGWLSPGTEPGQVLKTAGWSVGDRPASSHFNWLMKTISDWVAYFDDSVDTINSSVSSTEASIAAIQGDVTSIQSQLSAEEQARSAAIAAVRAVIESFRPTSESFVLTAQDEMNGFIELSVGSIVEDSDVVVLDRVFLHKNIDYSLTAVNERVRLTFINDCAAGGAEALGEGDRILFKYWKITSL